MKNIRTVSGDTRFIDKLQTEKIAFRLVAAYTKTCEIEGISSAGLPGKLHLTPPADMEALYYGKAKCLPAMPEAPTGPPSPVILAIAVQSFMDIPLYFIDAGLKTMSEAPALKLAVYESASIMDGAGVSVQYLVAEGKKYAKNVNSDDDIEIIAECVPGGTTTAYSLCRALGYECDNMFSASSIEPEHANFKKSIVDEAIKKHGMFDDIEEACKYYGDNMQPFVAGAVAEISKEKPVVLAGGTQMLAVYALIKKLNLDANFENIAVVTTRWVVDDEYSDFKGLANLIDPKMNAFCCDFYMDSYIANLALYEKGMVKEGVGAGALLTYAFANNIEPSDILDKVESLYCKLFK